MKKETEERKRNKKLMKENRYEERIRRKAMQNIVSTYKWQLNQRTLNK